MFSIVTNVELVKVNDPDTLFAAAAAAGIGFMETAAGMEWRDDGPYLRVEQTRRIRKARPARVKAGKADTPEARKARIEAYRDFYDTMPALKMDKGDRDTTDYGSPWN